jgi:creatinine amidohydrolase/Fe(II)-dependent formamide hydrolase-like protein
MHEMTQFTTLSSHETFTILGAEFIMATFNTNIRKVIYVNSHI